jgi:hypothetical protein
VRLVVSGIPLTDARGSEALNLSRDRQEVVVNASVPIQGVRKSAEIGK